MRSERRESFLIKLIENQGFKFVEKSEIVFNATKGLTLFINATELKQISGYEFPLRLIFEPTPPSISIQRFKPIFK